jgi:hypothetical protein
LLPERRSLPLMFHDYLTDGKFCIIIIMQAGFHVFLAEQFFSFDGDD